MPPAIDTHLHVWERGPGKYGWLKPEFGALYDDFSPNDAARVIADAGVDGAILVQADDTVADTASMLAAADTHEWIVGVVGWVPLDNPAEARRQLDWALENPVFCGVRQLVHDDPRSGVYLMPEVRETSAVLAGAGIALDIPDAWPRDLPDAVDLAAAVPEVTMVLDHAGKPPVARDDVEAWKKVVARLAHLPNTVVKFSGLHHPDRPFTLTDASEVWDVCLELFGPGRMMVGSDWPITVPYGGYAPTWETMSDFVALLSPDEQVQVLSGTAARVYGRSSRLTRVARKGEN